MRFILFKGLKDCFNRRIDEPEVVCYESQKLLLAFLLKIEKIQLVEVIVK